MALNPLRSSPGMLALFGLCLAACALPASAIAEELVMDFRGSESRNTPEFEVRAPWLLDWRITTDGAYESAVEVSLETAGIGAHEGRVLMTKQPGNGVRLFDNEGRFYFRVSSSFANWHLKVIQLTEEEAERYTPREP
ncbi:MAG: hypothetical protein V2I57_05900 [Xanthomonadales bacterium]|jgi:hypothetical protein|nr:hypothetical protein [Xanthomonadales bacterium]